MLVSLLPAGILGAAIMSFTPSKFTSAYEKPGNVGISTGMSLDGQVVSCDSILAVEILPMLKPATALLKLTSPKRMSRSPFPVRSTASIVDPT